VTNEVYVADGYRNRRVIVLDADTFAFKRMWGAYGNKPDDAPLGPYNPNAPPAQQFRLPHNIAVSRDGFVYVADRPNNRIQVFRKDGTYVSETFVSKPTLLQGAASGFALSTDPQQRFLYMIDGANHHVWILERQSMRSSRASASRPVGRRAQHPHAIAVDSRGNIYIGENFDARRFQRFLYKGLGTPKPGAIPPTTSSL
jgi:DNA-binding beta-propeller fold protein YncE